MDESNKKETMPWQSICNRHPKSVRLKMHQNYSCMKRRPLCQSDTKNVSSINNKKLMFKFDNNKRKFTMILYLLLVHCTCSIMGADNKVDLEYTVENLVKRMRLSDNVPTDVLLNETLFEAESENYSIIDSDRPLKLVNITEQLRPLDPYRFRKKILKLAVILPMRNDRSTSEFTLRKVLPLIDMASKAVTHHQRGHLPGWKLIVNYRDSNCSSTDGPLAAFEFYIKGLVGKYLDSD